MVPVEQPQQQYYAQPPPAQQQYYAQDPSQAPQYAQQQQQQYYAQDPSQAQYAQPPQQQYYQEPPAQHYGTPAKADAIVPAEEASPAGVADLDDVSQALKSLVNDEDTTERPIDKLSMYHEDEKTKKSKASNKSRGQTGKASDCGMAGRSLAEVRQLHGNGMRQPPNQEVMKAHAFDPAASQAGMMVVYGSGHNYANGPPPIGPAAGTGFGLGATLPGGGYGGVPPQPQQQQQAYATY